MEPTLRCARPGDGCSGESSDRVFVLRFGGPVEPNRGDLVVFETPPLALERCGAGGTFVKRIIGLPGEAVSERDGVIYVDGEELDEPWLRSDGRSVGSGGWVVEPGEYFMAGDNRRDSCDSRVWGAIARESLIGEVVAVYWPPGRFGFR